MTTTQEKDIDKLNEFLRGEIAAVETYNQCIEKVDDSTIGQELRTLCQSHAQRVAILERKVAELGGVPSRDSGTWGSFAKAAEGGAKVFGSSAAISMLEEGEDHGKKQYEKHTHDLSPDVRQFIEREILPDQDRTHDALSALQSRT